MPNLQQVSFTSPYSAEQEEIKRNRRLAEQLRQQAETPMPAGNMAGGYYVATNPLQHLAQALKGYSGMKGMEEADQKEKDLATRMEGARSGEMQGIIKALQGTPARPQAMGADDQAMIADQGGEAAPVVPAVPGDPNAAAVAALGSQFGDIRGMAPGMLAMGEARATREDAQQFRAQEAQLAREARAQELQMRLQDSRLNAADRAALQRELAVMQDQTRREIAALTAAGRRDAAADRNRPPAGFRFTPNGDLERIPGGPADIKAEAELQKRSAGAGDVDVALGTLRDAYGRLEEGGGITSTKNSGPGNVLPALASSGIGQTVGKVFGTNNQSARNDIAMARPALLAALMKATGMSAKQMDSNAELKLWLSTATDPTLDVESNRRALDNIEKKYISPQQTRRATDVKPGASGDWAIVK